MCGYLIPKCKLLPKWIIDQNNRINPFDLNFCSRRFTFSVHSEVFFSHVQLLSDDFFCVARFLLKMGV